MIRATGLFKKLLPRHYGPGPTHNTPDHQNPAPYVCCSRGTEYPCAPWEYLDWPPGQGLGEQAIAQAQHSCQAALYQ